MREAVKGLHRQHHLHACWRSIVDWDSIKGYLRPLLHEGHHSAANPDSVCTFLQTQQLTKRQQLTQQMDVEMEKVDDALRLNPKRKSDVLLRASASFDAQFVYDQIVAPATGWASLDEVSADDDELHSKILQLMTKLKLLNADEIMKSTDYKPCCSKGHPLKKVMDIFRGAICDGSKSNGDRCGARLPRNTPRYSCKKNGCDYGKWEEIFVVVTAVCFLTL